MNVSLRVGEREAIGDIHMKWQLAINHSKLEPRV